MINGQLGISFEQNVTKEKYHLPASSHRHFYTNIICLLMPMVLWLTSQTIP